MNNWFGAVRDRVITRCVISIVCFLVALFFMSMGPYLITEFISLQYVRLVASAFGAVGVMSLIDTISIMVKTDKELREQSTSHLDSGQINGIY